MLNKKRIMRKIAWCVIIIGGVCSLILLGIASDVIHNQREEFPWFTLPLTIVAVSSYILGFALITAVLIKKRF